MIEKVMIKVQQQGCCHDLHLENLDPGDHHLAFRFTGVKHLGDPVITHHD